MAKWMELSRRASLRVLCHRHFFAGCLFTALLVRLLFIALFDARPLSDFGWYFDKGRDIAAGVGYVVKNDGFPLWGPGQPLETPRPTAFWPVGYPAFLGALFFSTSWLVDPLWAAKIANALLYVAAIGAVAYTTKVAFSELAARITTLILTFLPNHIAYTSLTSVEIYFLFLTTGAIGLTVLHRQRKRLAPAVAAGVLFGLAILTKPQSVLLPGAVVLALSFRDWRRGLRLGLVIYAVALFCVLPWSLRNYHAFGGRFVFVSNNGGINLLISNMPGSWGRDGLMWNKELDHIVTATEDEIDRDKQARAVFVDYAKKNPGAILRELPDKLFAFVAADVDGFGWNQGAVTRFRDAPIWTPFRVVSQLYYLAIGALAIACLWHHRKNPEPAARAGLVVILYFGAICLVFTGGARFHFPVVPWLAAYAGGLLAGLLRERAPVY
jgi:4-amino-4-deoxy-L-arabinose transferase-like glycosyltransferase